MTRSALTIWTNAKFPDEVRSALAANVAPHRLIYAGESNRSNLAAAPVDSQLAAADIAFGQPDAEQASNCVNSKRRRGAPYRSPAVYVGAFKTRSENG